MVRKEEFQYLFEKRNRFCLSIFLPTRRAGLIREVEEGRIQLKDLLHDAESCLTAAGLGRAEAEELLAPAQQLVERSEFWRYQSDGLAIFLAPGFFRYFNAPRKLQPFVAVADRFDMTPLLPLWTSENPFYLLALSLNRVRFFEGTEHTIFEVKLESLPTDLHEVLDYGVNQSTRQQHTLRAGLPEDALLYFRQIDQALHNLLNEQQAPLVLAAVEENLSLYHQANTYPALLDEGVTGNPDRLSADELLAKAQTIVQAYYHQVRNQAVMRYKECLDPAKTSKQLTAILPAAYQGRIYNLFVPMDAQKWGYFDSEHNVVFEHERPEARDQDLLNLAVVQTILHGGSVYALNSSEMPDGGSAAALFRY